MTLFISYTKNQNCYSFTNLLPPALFLLGRPRTVPGTGDTVSNWSGKFPALIELTFQIELLFSLRWHSSMGDPRQLGQVFQPYRWISSCSIISIIYYHSSIICITLLFYDTVLMTQLTSQNFSINFRILDKIKSGGSEVKASASNAGDLGLIPGSGRSPGEGNGNPLQYFCLENPMDGEAWQATVHGVAKSRIRLSDFTFLRPSQMWVRSLSWEDPLEEGMATHSSILA